MSAIVCRFPLGALDGSIEIVGESAEPREQQSKIEVGESLVFVEEGERSTSSVSSSR